MNYFYKKFLICITFTTLIAFNCAYAAPNNKIINEDPSTFMMHYFENPQSNKLIPSLKQTLASNYMQGFKAKLLIHFYAAAINNSENKNQLLQELSQLKKQCPYEQQSIINAIIAAAKNFRSPPADSSDNFDFLWAEFFATGNKESVEKIASYLKMETYHKKIEVFYLAAAEWSLASNAHQFPQVYVILKNIYASSTGIMRRRLKRIIDNPAEIATRFDSSYLLKHAPNFKTFKAMVW